jgi:hypothetical protein
MTKTDLTVIAVLVTAGLMAIEAHHRVDLVAPAEAAAPAPEVDPACTLRQRRYLARRLVFLSSGVAAALTPLQPSIDRTPQPANCPN